MTESFTVVRIYFDSMSADLAQAVLRGEGVDSVLMGDGASGWQPMLTNANGIRLCVRDSEADLAAEILATPPVRTD